MVDSDKLEEILETVCRPMAKQVGEFVNIDDDELGAAIMCAMLVTNEGQEASDTDLEGVIKWAKQIQMQATMLQFLLAGATQMRVVDGDAQSKMIDDPSLMMQRLVACGIAKRQGT